ncbi:hypothetical protein [Sphingomonas pituitosa]|uniref:hypothetical protein n=1 Tax=Sphingomonas pituitosa TaxID=99597 RepID=UPI000A763C58|nr:hypothetical protein [Sphingomonas pituitosa]
MQDTPDARTLRRRRTALLLLCGVLLLLSARGSLVEDVQELVHGLHEGFFDDASSG